MIAVAEALTFGAKLAPLHTVVIEPQEERLLR